MLEIAFKIRDQKKRKKFLGLHQKMASKNNIYCMEKIR
jgi:hypothetical protein